MSGVTITWSTIPARETDEFIKSSVDDFVPIPRESEVTSDNDLELPLILYGYCKNHKKTAKTGQTRTLNGKGGLGVGLSVVVWAGVRGMFVKLLWGGTVVMVGGAVGGGDFDEEEGEIDIDIFQIEDEILCEKLLNVNLLIDKIEALKLTPSILGARISRFLPYSPLWIYYFLDNLLNEDPIPEYERFTFDIEPDAPVINNFDELNEDECFDPGGGEIDVSQNIEDDDSFTFVIRTFLPYRTYPVDSTFTFSTKSERHQFFGPPAFPLRAGGISSRWNFHVAYVYPNIYEKPV
ncbi:hypothetical protein Tco_0745844 [Tanacetum coccineum]